MNPVSICAASLLALLSTPVRATDDPAMLRLVTCQDSWVEWKDDAGRLAGFGRAIESQYLRGEAGDAFTPRRPQTLFGFPISRLYPQSVGMGLGYSVVVDAPFANVRQRFEKALGRPLHCSVSEGMRACELPLAAEKTALLLASDRADATTTQLGCYYLYEK